MKKPREFNIAATTQDFANLHTIITTIVAYHEKNLTEAEVAQRITFDLSIPEFESLRWLKEKTEHFTY